MSSTYDNEVTLISKSIVEDEIGNQLSVPIEQTVLCCELSVSRSEFYNAAANGLKPTKVLKVHRFEYNNETKIKYEDIPYKVIRTYAVNNEEIELTCEKVIGNG